MARLTDNNGVLLGGLETSWDRLLIPLTELGRATVNAPEEPLIPAEFEPGEVIFALQCSYGSFSYLTFSSAPVSRAAGGSSRAIRQMRCEALVEEPSERHYCAGCGGYYCAVHAEPVAHDCRSALRKK